MQKLLRGCAILATLTAACTTPLAPPPAVFPVKIGWQHPVDEGIQAPLASDGRRLFVATRSGSVAALDLADGSTLWTADVGRGVLGADPEGVVVRSADGTLTGLDPRSGKFRWKVSTAVEGPLPPLVLGGSVYVAGAGTAALDASTGRVLWTATDGGDVIAPLTATEEFLYQSEAGGVLRCRRRSSGASTWTFDLGSESRGAPAVSADGTVYAGAGRSLQAVRADGGKRRWRWGLGADALMPPAIREKSVILAAHDATLYALNSATGELNWRAPLPSRPQSGPMIFGVVVLVACLDNEVSAFDARTGRSLGEMRATSPILEAPLLVGGSLYAALRDVKLPDTDALSSVEAYSLNLSSAAPVTRPQKGKGKPPNRNP